MNEKKSDLVPVKLMLSKEVAQFLSLQSGFDRTIDASIRQSPSFLSWKEFQDDIKQIVIQPSKLTKSKLDPLSQEALEAISKIPTLEKFAELTSVGRLALATRNAHRIQSVFKKIPIFKSVTNELTKRDFLLNVVNSAIQAVVNCHEARVNFQEQQNLFSGYQRIKGVPYKQQEKDYPPINEERFDAAFRVAYSALSCKREHMLGNVDRCSELVYSTARDMVVAENNAVVIINADFQRIKDFEQSKEFKNTIFNFDSKGPLGDIWRDWRPGS